MITLSEIRQAEGLTDKLQELRARLEERMNPGRYSTNQKQISPFVNMLQRMALLAGLSQPAPRVWAEVEQLKLASRGDHIHDTTFRSGIQSFYTGLLKLRYHSLKPDWDNNAIRSKIVNTEIIRGINLLLQGDTLDQWLLHTIQLNGQQTAGDIPRLDLSIGSYEDDLPARLDLNGKAISNTQILIAGTTGSGKSNLLAVLIHEIRAASVESNYPVNFLLFDYKGEFGDPTNRAWLQLFEVDETAVLDPLHQPLPFTPFKDFSGRTQNEINLYATELAGALIAVDRANMSANMSNRLAEAVINAYRQTHGLPIDFESLLREYTQLQVENQRTKDDSVRSVLKQLIRSNLFEKQDRVDLIKESYIIKMDGFPKDGPIAKAIVYFVISKLNTIYQTLPKQAVTETCVELRHFTIIDEAHYMLDFDNRPLRELIATGRNKGLSIILATQNMDSYKSEHFDFYANAQYPLIMKQQSINDRVLKDLFGVTGGELTELKEAITNLQKGELILKDSLSNASCVVVG